MRHQFRTGTCLFVVTLALLFTGCGGGGGGGGGGLDDDNDVFIPAGSPGPGTGGGGGSTGSGGGGSGGGGLPDLNFRVELSGDFALVSTPAFPVARTQAEYSAMMQQYLPPISTFAPPTPIDFANEMVFGIFLGNRPTSGYSVVVTAVERNGDGATVTWEERQPGPGGVGATVLTSPFVIIVMTKVTGAIDFGG